MVDINEKNIYSKKEEYTPNLNEMTQPLNISKNDLEAPSPYMNPINPPEYHQSQYSSQISPPDYQFYPQYPKPQNSYEIPPSQYQNQPQFEYKPLPINQSQQVYQNQPQFQYYPQIQNGIQIQYNEPIPNNQYENNVINDISNVNSKISENRLKCQKAMIILLFINALISLVLQFLGITTYITSFDDLLIIILGVWILYYTKKRENSRNNKMGTYIVISLFFGLEFRVIGFASNKKEDFFILSFLLLAYSFYLRIGIAIASFKCKCCKCCN